MPVYRIEWLDEAKSDVRKLDRPTAMRIFEGLLRFAQTGHGDVRALQGEYVGSARLRVGDYRVLFSIRNETIHIPGVRHRSEAYR